MTTSIFQFGEIKSEYPDLSLEEFTIKTEQYKTELKKLFVESKSLENEILAQLDLLKYEK